MSEGRAPDVDAILFCYASPNSHLLLDSQVLKCLWRERELARSLPADGAWRWTEGEKPINAGLTPVPDDARQGRVARPRNTRTFCDNTRLPASAV